MPAMEHQTTVTKPEKKSVLEKAVGELTALLEAKNPETFGPKWIADQCEPLRQKIKSKARNAQGRLDWSIVISRLDEKWQGRWQRDRAETGRTWEQEMKALKDLLEKEDPIALSPTWIEEHAEALYGRIRKHSEGKRKGKFEWSNVLEGLDSKWRQRWSPAKGVERNRTLEDEARALVLLLETEDPLSFGPNWIVTKNHPLYERMRAHIPAKSGRVLDWPLVLSLLPKKWQQRWTYEESVEPGRAFAEEVAALASLLEGERPLTFSSSWIADQNQALYARLLKNIRDDGRPNWDKVRNALPESWRDKWKQVRVPFEHRLPKEWFEDADAVEKILEIHREKLYTFLSLLKHGDGKERDAICRDLIHMAQRGNRVAEQKMIELLMPLVHEWIDKDPELAVYKHDAERVNDRIRRCMYLFQSDQEDASFAKYVFATLKLGSRGLQYQRAQSLDQPLGYGDERTLLDMIAQNEVEEEAA